MKLTQAAKLRILYFLVFSCTASWLPIFAEYLEDRGVSGVQRSTILSITPVMMFVVQPLIGAWADKTGYKKMLQLSAFFSAVSYLFYLLPGTFISYLAITIGMSLFYNGIQPLLDSISLQLVQKDATFSYGSLRVAGAAGWAFTGIMVGKFIDMANTSVIFIFSAASMFLAFLFTFFLEADDIKQTHPSVKKHRALSPVFSSRSLIFILVCVFLISTCGTAIWNFYSIYMKENGASASLVGYGLSLQGLCELPLFYFSAVIIRKFGIKATLLITVFATALRMFLYSQVKDPQAALMIELLHGISWSLFWVVCVEYVNSLVKEEWRATGQSLLYAAYFGVGAIAGNYWTGYLYEEKLRMPAIFLLNAGMVFMVGLLVIVFMRRRQNIAR